MQVASVQLCAWWACGLGGLSRRAESGLEGQSGQGLQLPNGVTTVGKVSCGTEAITLLSPDAIPHYVCHGGGHRHSFQLGGALSPREFYGGHGKDGRRALEQSLSTAPGGLRSKR